MEAGIFSRSLAARSTSAITVLSNSRAWSLRRLSINSFIDGCNEFHPSQLNHFLFGNAQHLLQRVGHPLSHRLCQNDGAVNNLEWHDGRRRVKYTGDDAGNPFELIT